MDGALASADMNGMAGQLPKCGPFADALRRERLRYGTRQNIRSLETQLDQRIGEIFLKATDLTAAERELLQKHQDTKVFDLLELAMRIPTTPEFSEYDALANIDMYPGNPLSALWELAEEM